MLVAAVAGVAVTAVAAGSRMDNVAAVARLDRRCGLLRVIDEAFPSYGGWCRRCGTFCE
jgi:hypothetical protein